MAGIPLPERMKLYESASDTHLPRRLPVVVRIDGKRFSRLAKILKLERPWDSKFAWVMTETAKRVAEETAGCVVAYTQSDEISLVLRNDQDIATEPYLDNRVQKICSVLASAATGWFGRCLAAQRFIPLSPPMFDARVFVLPDFGEVVNYLVWRQRDCVRNSILNAARWGLAEKGKDDQGNSIGLKTAQKMMHGLDSKRLQELMFSNAGINWNDFDPEFKRGIAMRRETFRWDGLDGQPVVRSKWCFDEPTFSSPEGREWLEQAFGTAGNSPPQESR